jgi:2,3-bisphosphoglycerate-independent phosphoglycerate mutase
MLTQQDFPDQDTRPLRLHLVTMNAYDTTFQNVQVMFQADIVTHSFGEHIASLGLSQLRIAETEKYPHVTYFFSGGREEPFTKEKRVLIPSPKVATYDLQPEMSAHEVKDATIHEIQTSTPDFICLNFANPDMVGHTGVFSAAVKACETVDACLKEVVEAALDRDYRLIVTADHGNADLMINPDGSPHTSHTLNPVPVFVLAGEIQGPLRDGTLIDIAPTLCHLMDLPVPGVMTGKPLFEAEPTPVQ